MKTKNIFKVLLLTAILLAGAGSAKADKRVWNQTTVGGICYENHGGSETSILISNTEFEGAEAGNKLRVHATVNDDSDGRWTFFIASNYWYSNLQFSNWLGSETNKTFDYDTPSNYDAEKGYFQFVLSESSLEPMAGAAQGGIRIQFLGLTVTEVWLITSDDEIEPDPNPNPNPDPDPDPEPDPIVREYVTANIDTETGFATFCSTKALDFSEVTTLKAYYAKEVTQDTVRLIQVTGTVAAGTGLLLRGVTTQIPVIDEAGTSYSDNLLQGVTETAVSVNAANQYVLVDKNGTVKFADTASRAATVPSGKAYLVVTSGGSSRSLVFGFGDEATAVRTVTTATAKTTAVFNLHGQRVVRPSGGLFIVNGKKVILKQ